MKLSKNNNQNDLNKKHVSALASGSDFQWKFEDVARACCVSVRTVAKWCKGRRIPYMKVGKSVRFNPDAVKSALDKFVVEEVSQ